MADVIGSPSSGYHRDFFTMRFLLMVNDVPTEIRGNDRFAELYSSQLQTSVSLFTVSSQIASLLTSSDHFNVRILQCFYDNHAPILSVVFPPQTTLKNVKSLLSQREDLSEHVGVEISSIFAANATFCSLKVDIELYLCSPCSEKKLNLLTLGNSQFYVDMFERSLCLQFPSLIEQKSTGHVNIGGYTCV